MEQEEESALPTWKANVGELRLEIGSGVFSNLIKRCEPSQSPFIHSNPRMIMQIAHEYLVDLSRAAIGEWFEVMSGWKEGDAWLSMWSVGGSD